MRYAICALFLFASCSLVRSAVDRPGLVEATNSVWHDAYKRSDSSPAVHVVTTLDCTSDVNGLPGFWCPTVGCRQGCTFDPWSVNVATADAWSKSTLAHEMMHVLKMRKAIEAHTPEATIQFVGDRYHSDPEWQVGSDVDLANAMLSERGL